MAIEALKKESFIIFISGLNLYKTPEVVQKAIASDEAMGPTPIIAVTDAKVEKKIGVVPYSVMKDVEGFTKIRTAIGEHRGMAYQPKITNYKVETWKDTRGRSIQATYVTSAADIVTLKLQNGKLATMAVAKLSEASQQRVKELAAE